MKKIIILALCVLLSISLFSCEKIKGLLGIGDTENTDTEAPKTDEEKLNELLDELKASLKLSEQEEISFKEAINKISEISFSIEDLEFDTERSDAYVVFNDSTLYISDKTSTEQIIRIFEHGILTVSNTGGKVQSSMITFDEIGNNMTSVDLDSIADALVFEKGDLAKTDKEHVYKVNRSFLLKLGRSLSANEDFSLDRDNEPTVIIDMSEYDLSDKLIITVTDKDEESTAVISLSVKDDGSDKLISISVASESAEADAVIRSRGGEVRKIRMNGTENADGIETRFELEYKSSDDGAGLSFSIEGENMSMELDASLSDGGEIKKAEASINALTPENASVRANLSYDEAAFSKVGESGLTLSIELLAEGSMTEIDIVVNTDEFTQTGSKHTVAIEYSDSNESGNGSAAVYFPAKSSPTVTKASKLHLDHGTSILKNYTAYKAKAQSINNEMTSLLSSNNFGALSASYSTYDPATGIYYITSISYDNGKYVSTTYSSPDAFRTAYICRQNLGGFKNEAISKAESYARKLAPLIEEDRAYGGGDYCTYTYIEDYDVYLIMKNDDYLTLWISVDEPQAYQTLSGMKLHKLAFYEDGKVDIHTYKERVTDECSLQYVCSHCGFVKRTGIKAHDYSTDIFEADDNGNLLWRLTDCKRCNECVIKVNDGDIGVTFTLEQMSEYYLLDARSYEGFEDFKLSADDYTYCLVITGMKVNGELGNETNIEIAIPDLSEYCEYRIVGIDDARDYYRYEDLSIKLVIPEGVEFINETSFLQVKFITEITLPSTLRIICDGAFSGCEALCSVIFNSIDTYVGEDVFEGTLVNQN